MKILEIVLYNTETEFIKLFYDSNKKINIVKGYESESFITCEIHVNMNEFQCKYESLINLNLLFEFSENFLNCYQELTGRCELCSQDFKPDFKLEFIFNHFGDILIKGYLHMFRFDRNTKIEFSQKVDQSYFINSSLVLKGEIQKLKDIVNVTRVVDI